MMDAALMKLRARDEVSQEEERAFRGLFSEVVEHRADEIVVRAHVEQDSSRVLLNGILCRYKDLRNGERQITELHVSGDFVDLHSFTLKRLDHNILALVPSRVAVVPHKALVEISEKYPHFTRLLWFSTNLDAAVHREWAVSLGRRTAIARVAHLVCELYIRLEIVGLAGDLTYELPLTQGDIAECLGLTSVHVNRVLKELREQELATFRGSQVRIHDMDALKRIAEFDETYLYLNRQPR
jgi:CRP-like cAMP-binding protein